MIPEIAVGNALPGWAGGILCGFDTETTGTDIHADRIVSAAVMLDDPSGELSQTCTWLIQPEIPISLGATAVHGISDEYAQDHGTEPAETIATILAVLERLAEYPLVLVNAPFDLSLLHAEACRYGLGSSFRVGPVIDTLTLDRQLDKYRRGRRTLTAASAAYGICIRGAHTAEGDVTCAIRLARAIGERYPFVADADMEWLQLFQQHAHANRAAEFENYRHMDGMEPDFTVSRDWPYEGAPACAR